MMSVLFQPGRIGSVTTANRVVRAGTSETAAADSGDITDDLVEIYETLAANQVGVLRHDQPEPQLVVDVRGERRSLREQLRDLRVERFATPLELGERSARGSGLGIMAFGISGC